MINDAGKHSARNRLDKKKEPTLTNVFVNIIFVNIYFVHNKCVHMKRLTPPKDIPVSQRQLARYLGISTSMMNMSQSTRYPSHQLSSGYVLKMEELVISHRQAQRSGIAGSSWRKLQDSFNTDTAKAIKKLASDAAYFESRAGIFKRRLEEMAIREREDRQWLNTVDHMLAKLSHAKEQQTDRKWLQNQQAVVETRLQKNGILAQAKLEIQVEMNKAKALAIRAAIKKLTREMK